MVNDDGHIEAQFLSTPSVWRATRADRTGCSARSYFYPRPPCGGRQHQQHHHHHIQQFLSTPSVWRATDTDLRSEFGHHNFYPRPPCGGRPLQSCTIALKIFYFYPRPPCGGRPVSVWFLCGGVSDFYPRPPCGGRRYSGASGTFRCNFYPRPPCGGRPARGPRLFPCCYFYPRPPCGGRRAKVECAGWERGFLSTPSVWRATGDGNATRGLFGFLSTPSVWRATSSACSPATVPYNFYPRPPCGGRPLDETYFSYFHEISIHALRVEGDGRKVTFRVHIHLISIHALRVEGDPNGSFRASFSTRFLSTPSVWRATTVPIWYLQIGLIFLSTPSVWRATTAWPCPTAARW